MLVGIPLYNICTSQDIAEFKKQNVREQLKSTVVLQEFQ